MRTSLAALLLAGLGATGLTVAAQQTPNLNATWTATKEVPTGLGLAPSPIFGPTFSAAISGDTLTLTRVPRANSPSVVTVIPLTGAETPTVVPGRQCFGDVIQNLSATRTPAGFDLVVVSAVSAGGTVTKSGLTYKFRADADTLVIEATIGGAAGAKQVGTVYRRSTDTMPPPAKAPNVTVAPATISALSWLAGDWVGVLGTSDVEERWTAPAGGTMIGTSRTTRSNGASFSAFEFLCVTQRAGGLVYTAMPNGSGTTDFLATKVEADSITFENPDHDFPKVIRYAKRADGGIDASISGAPGSKVTTYSFKKK